MKTFQTACLAALLAAPPLAAQAQWYVGADGGVNFMQDSDIDGTDTDGSTFTSKSSNKAGYTLQTQAGYDFGGPKAELELAYRHAGLKGIADGPDGKNSGHTSSLSVMANGVYEFLPQAKWHPFIGGGIGMSRVSARWKNDSETFMKDSDWVLAYQGLAGISYDLNKNWDLKAQYRYFSTLDASLTGDDGTKAEMDYSSHSILVGFTYNFGK